MTTNTERGRQRLGITLLASLLASCTHAADALVTTPEPVAVVEDAHQDELPPAHEATFGDVHVAIELVPTHGDDGGALIDHDLALGLLGRDHVEAPASIVARLTETYPLSDHAFDAVGERALTQCRAPAVESEQRCSEDRTCHETYAVVTDVRTGEVLRVHMLGTACGLLDDDKSFISVSARRTTVGRGLFVLVWDDTDDDPERRCGCNPEARSAHVVVLDGHGEAVLSEDTGFSIMTCPTGGSDSYTVAFRDIDHDGTKELVGTLSLGFEAPVHEEERERPWFVADFDIESVRDAVASSDATPAWCTALAPIAEPALERAAPVLVEQDVTPTRHTRPRRLPEAEREALHEAAMACECGALDACTALSVKLAEIGRSEWVSLLDPYLVDATLDACVRRDDDVPTCQAALFGPTLAHIPTPALRAHLERRCSTDDANACIGVARIDYLAGNGVSAAEAVLLDVCEDRAWHDVCALLAARTVSETTRPRVLRMLCEYGDRAACRESGLYARAHGLERRAREQFFAQSCP